MQLSGYIYGEGCVVLTGCARDTTSFNVNETRPVVSFNADGQGGVQLFGRSPSDFGLPTAANGFPLDLDVAGLATVTVHLPQPNASGGLDAGGKSLTARGQDDLVDLSLDVDNIIATAVGVPGLFGNSIDVGVGSLSYDIINVSMGPSIDLVQEFLLDPRLYVRLAFDEAVSIGGKVVDSFVSLWDQLPDITFLADRTTVTPTFFVDADLLNRTLLDFDLDFGIDLLEIGYDFGLLGKGSVGVGNVLDQSVDLFQSPALYRKQFPLRGFNAAQGSSFVIDFLAGSSGPIGAGTDRVADPSVLPGISNTTVVPEPASLALLALGLGALASSRRRRDVATARA